MKLIYIVYGALFFAIIYSTYWLKANYKPFMDYATKYPSENAALEYLGYRKRKDQNE